MGSVLWDRTGPTTFWNISIQHFTVIHSVARNWETYNHEICMVRQSANFCVQNLRALCDFKNFSDGYTPLHGGGERIEEDNGMEKGGDPDPQLQFRGCASDEEGPRTS